MADINVSLALDDSAYTAKIKAADTAAVQFAAHSTSSFESVKKGFDSVSNGVESLNKKFESLTSILIGVGVVEFAKSLLEGANELKDMSDALGVSVERFMEMRIAATQSGSSIDGMGKMLSKMEIAAGKAADAVPGMRDSFATLGVSLSDMQKMSPDQIFLKLAEGLARIDSPAERARLKLELLGKGAVSWDPKAYVEGIEKLYGTMDNFAESQRKASELSEQLKLKTELLRVAFTDLIAPIFELGTNHKTMAEQMETAHNWAILLAAALGAFAAAAAINAVTSLGKAVGWLAGLFGVATVTTATNTGAMLLNANAAIFMAGAHGRLGTAIAAVAVAEEVLAGLMAGGIVEGLVYAKAVDALAAAKTRVAIANTAVVTTEAAMATALGVGAAASSTAAVATGTLAVATGTIAAILTPVLVAVGALAAAWVIYNATIGESTTKTNSALGIMDGSILTSLFKNKAAVKALASEWDDLSLDKKVGLITAPVLNPLLGKDTNNTGLESSRALAASIAAQTFNLNAVNDRTIKRIQLEGLLAGMGKADSESRLLAFDSETKRLAEIFRIDQDIAKNRAEMNKLKPEDAKASGKSLVIAELEKQKTLLNNISFSAMEAKKLQVEQTQAAEMATYFLEQQAKAKESMLQLDYDISDLTKSTTQKQLDSVDRLIAKEKLLAIAKLQTQAGPGGTVSEEARLAAMAKIDAAYSGMKTKNQELVEQSRTFSTGWDKAWNDYTDNAKNAATTAANVFQKATQGMEDAIVNFAKTGKFEWKNFVSSMAEELLRSQVKQLMANMFTGRGGAGSTGGNILSGITKLFGFAEGGQVGGNTPILVGERGPEIFTPNTNGAIVPNHALGGGGGAVTLNISAVDAPSFQALVARNPQFIHAVAEMGRRSIPGGGR